MGNLFEFIETTMVARLISFILVYLSFVLPISFWLAYKKTMFYCGFSYTIAPMAVSSIFLWNQTQNKFNYITGLLFISSICMFINIYLCSVKYMKKREF